MTETTVLYVNGRSLEKRKVKINPANQTSIVSACRIFSLFVDNFSYGHIRHGFAWHLNNVIIVLCSFRAVIDPNPFSPQLKLCLIWTKYSYIAKAENKSLVIYIYIYTSIPFIKLMQAHQFSRELFSIVRCVYKQC